MPHRPEKLVYLVGSLFFVCSASALAQPDQPENPQVPAPPRPNSVHRWEPYTTRGKVPGDVQNGIDDLKKLYQWIVIYRKQNGGSYPTALSRLMGEGVKFPELYGVEGKDAFNQMATRTKSFAIFFNPDATFSDNPFLRDSSQGIIPYMLVTKRLSGDPLGSPKEDGTRDLLILTDLYKHENGTIGPNGETQIDPVGVWLALWEDGTVDKIPFDMSYVRILPKVANIEGVRMQDFLPNQAGAPDECASYAELATQINGAKVATIGKPIPDGTDEPVPDNGGPEALVQLSRWLAWPNTYGIDREALWQQLNPAQEKFTLSAISAASAKLGLPLEQRTLSLEELDKALIPAIFVAKDTARLNTLVTLDADFGVVQDQGLTRIIPREELAKVFGGQVLIKNAEPSALQITDPIRDVALKTADELLRESVKLTNTGKTALNLKLNRPVPGANQISLDKTKLELGESAELKLTLHWRPMLQGEAQTVLVTLNSDEGGHPKVLLGFRMTQEQAAR